MVASSDLIKTGFTGIDEIIGGFKPGSFNVVEGRPEGELYVFLLDIIQNALSEEYSVLYASLGRIVYDPSIQKRLSQILSANQGIFVKAREIEQSKKIHKEWENAIALNEVFSSSLTVIDADPSYYGRLSNLIAAITAWIGCHDGICIIDYPSLLIFEEENECMSNTWWFDLKKRLAEVFSSIVKETGVCVIVFDTAPRSFDVKWQMGSRFEDYRRYAERGPWFSYCDTQTLFLHLRKDSQYDFRGIRALTLNWNRNDKARVAVVKNSFGATGETILDYKYEDGIPYFL